MIKTILGYDITPGVTVEEYEQWLFNVHVPDILANPHVDKLVFNKVLRPVATSSDRSVAIAQNMSFYRIAEMHFADEAAYRRYLDWFSDHPIPADRGPAGRTDFRFYLLADTTEVSRNAPPDSGSR